MVLLVVNHECKNIDCHKGGGGGWSIGVQNAVHLTGKIILKPRYFLWKAIDHNF